MPEAAAIADQALRHGRRVQLDRAALHFLDPSFAPAVGSAAQDRRVLWPTQPWRDACGHEVPRQGRGPGHLYIVRRCPYRG